MLCLVLRTSGDFLKPWAALKGLFGSVFNFFLEGKSKFVGANTQVVRTSGLN